MLSWLFFSFILLKIALKQKLRALLWCLWTYKHTFFYTFGFVFFYWVSSCGAEKSIKQTTGLVQYWIYRTRNQRRLVCSFLVTKVLEGLWSHWGGGYVFNSAFSGPTVLHRQLKMRSKRRWSTEGGGLQGRWKALLAPVGLRLMLRLETSVSEVELLEFPGDGRQRLPLRLRQEESHEERRREAGGSERHQAELAQAALQTRGNSSCWFSKKRGSVRLVSAFWFCCAKSRFFLYFVVPFFFCNHLYSSE